MKVLTTGRLGKAFYDYYKKNTLGITVRYVAKLQQEDIYWADALAAFAPKEKVLLDSLQWIHSFGAGVETYLQREDLNVQTTLSRTVGNLGAKMGEYCLTHILNFYQNLHALRKQQEAKKWKQLPPTSCRSKKVLLLGTGEMATGIASVLKLVGIEVIGANSTGSGNDQFVQCIPIHQVSGIANQVAVVINTLPLTKYTEGLVDKAFFSAFQQILFINVGRGKTVPTADLKYALHNGNCAFAVLDVFEQEPLSEDADLWIHPKVMITPHQSAITDIQDVVTSFTSVYHSLQSKTENALFVDIAKGY